MAIHTSGNLLWENGSIINVEKMENIENTLDKYQWQKIGEINVNDTFDMSNLSIKGSYSNSVEFKKTTTVVNFINKEENILIENLKNFNHFYFKITSDLNFLTINIENLWQIQNGDCSLIYNIDIKNLALEALKLPNLLHINNKIDEVPGVLEDNNIILNNSPEKMSYNRYLIYPFSEIGAINNIYSYSSNTTVRNSIYYIDNITEQITLQDFISKLNTLEIEHSFITQGNRYSDETFRISHINTNLSNIKVELYGLPEKPTVIS